jgi:hypothetical protein
VTFGSHIRSSTVRVLTATPALTWLDNFSYTYQLSLVLCLPIGFDLGIEPLTACSYTVRHGMSGDLETVHVHGRLFQKVSIDEGIYCVPIASDDGEEDRLIAQHKLLYRLLGDSLVSARVRLHDPRKVLDLGYGGGDWCAQFAEEYEDCEVRLS